MFVFLHQQANHGGVKGKLPAGVLNQDPASSGQGKQGGSSGDGDASDDEEEERAETPEQDEELNRSDSEDDSNVSAKTLPKERTAVATIYATKE